MKPDKYTIIELFSDRNIEQIIIPEIQRDYVWEAKQINDLLNTIKDDYNIKIKALEDDKIIKSLPIDAREIYIKQKYSSNIGFIYAYHDKEYADKYFLIDGQQRLTTIYLLLLAIALKTNKIDEFKQRYFNNEILKIDYKVREASHDFLQKFFENMLNGIKIENIENKFWYFSEYKNDKTICSIINNYKTIEKHLNNKEIDTYDYGKHIEKYVDFWYFDTNISEQGEELYIYMNSRGETVQPSENIKAMLLEQISDNNEKNNWGKKWEEWQDFFWKNRKDNLNADNGFNSFLKWIQIIENIKNNSNDFSSLEKLRELENSLKDNKNITLSLTIIEQYIIVFKLIIEEFTQKNDFVKNTYKKYGDIKSIQEILLIDKWLTGDDDTINKISFFPILLFAKETFIDKNGNINENINWLSFYRLARFFHNILQFENVIKAPYFSYRNSILIVNSLLEFNKFDIVDLIDLIKENKFLPSETILTEEEKFKLQLYKTSSYDRVELEQIIWNAEDHNLNNGRIFFLLKCIGIEFAGKEINSKDFDLLEFAKFKTIFEDLFSIPNDIRIRALLTKGDYTLLDGTNPTLGGDRYTFGNNDSDWEKIISLKATNEKLKELFVEIIKFTSSTKFEDVMKKIIKEYIDEKENKKDWYYNFVKNPKILEYCRQKKICWVSEDEIYLLTQTKATEGNYIELNEF